MKKIEIIERITDANGSISENILTSWEHKNQFIPEIIRFGELKIYLQERIVKKNDSDVHLSKYEYDILLLFAGAEHILQENGINLKHLNSNKLQEQIADLIFQKKSLNTQYVSFKQEIKELELIHQNLSKYLKQDAPEIQRSSHNQLPSL